MNAEKKDANWYWEIVVNCQPDLLDVFTYRLFEAGIGGTEEVFQNERIVQLKLYFEGGFKSPSAIVDSIKKDMAVSESQIAVLNAEKKRMENWQANWKKHFRPLEIGANFIVLPPWEEKSGDKKHIVIHPGFGFGTGYHESTNLALQLLEWLTAHIQLTSVIDIGTGSGILAIAALHMGAVKVEAIDIDPDAVAEVGSNLELSGFDPNLCKTTVSDPGNFYHEPYNVVMANIEDHILSKLAKDLIRLTESQGWLLLSGILTERKLKMLTSFSNTKIIKELHLNEWTGLILQKE
jgi:ribosomal protein L11 methyltransferase